MSESESQKIFIFGNYSLHSENSRTPKIVFTIHVEGHESVIEFLNECGNNDCFKKFPNEKFTANIVIECRYIYYYYFLEQLLKTLNKIYSILEKQLNGDVYRYTDLTFSQCDKF